MMSQSRDAVLDVLVSSKSGKVSISSQSRAALNVSFYNLIFNNRSSLKLAPVILTVLALLTSIRPLHCPIWLLKLW